MIAYYLPVGTDRIPGLESGETDIESFIEEASLAEAERFDIDKAWQGIHYLLCGDPWEGAPPLSDLVLGGTELGSADYGCGPARLLGPARVQACARAAAALDFEALRQSYDWRKFLDLGIYPRFDHDEFDYLSYYFSQLRDFYLRTAEEGKGLLLFIS